MEVIWFKEITGRDREEDIETNRRQKRTFQAITDTAEGGPDQVLAYVEVPSVGDFLTYVDESTGAPIIVLDDTVVVIRRRAEQLDADNLCNWTITVEYLGVDEPESQPAEVEFSPTRYQEHVIDDVTGTPILNTAGDSLAEGAMRDRTRFTLQIVKNIRDEDWDPITAATYQDSLNADAFLAGKYAAHPDGFAAGTCKLTLTAKRVRKKGLTEWFWVRTATIEIDLRGWGAKFRSAGFYYFEPLVSNLVRFIDAETGHPSSMPRLLAADGTDLPYGGTPVICNGPDGFQVYEEADWTAITPPLEY